MILCFVDWRDRFAKECNLFRLTYMDFRYQFCLKKHVYQILLTDKGTTDSKMQGSDLRKKIS